MIERLHQLTERYRTAGIVVDTNLFMLFLVGRYDPRRVSTFKRTSRYSIEDFEFLNLILEPFHHVITTPHILAEISNLSGTAGGHFDRRYFVSLKSHIAQATEVYLPAQTLLDKREYETYGLTDTGILYTAIGEYAVLTDDLPLYVQLDISGVDALNFTQLKQSYFLD